MENLEDKLVFLRVSVLWMFFVVYIFLLMVVLNIVNDASVICNISIEIEIVFTTMICPLFKLINAVEILAPYSLK